MTWIDDRLAQWTRKKENDRAIADCAEAIFNELWDEVKQFVHEANSKGFQLTTNGSPHQRVIQCRGEVLRITLNRDAEVISVEAPTFNFTLSFAVGNDGVVGLKCNEKRVSLFQAARLVLDPFLFPDLQE